VKMRFLGVGRTVLLLVTKCRQLETKQNDCSCICQEVNKYVSVLCNALRFCSSDSGNIVNSRIFLFRPSESMLSACGVPVPHKTSVEVLQ
jgi:hypothetical protein